MEVIVALGVIGLVVLAGVLIYLDAQRHAEKHARLHGETYTTNWGTTQRAPDSGRPDDLEDAA